MNSGVWWPAESPRPWLALCLVLAIGAAVAYGWPASMLEWRPEAAREQPWRLFSALFAHRSGVHLAANAAVLVMVAAIGALLHVGPRDAIAWLLCWPLVQAALWLAPAVTAYVGLSGVLHAGVAVCAVAAVRRKDAGVRAIGFALIAGLMLKTWIEAPWEQPLHQSPLLGLPVVPLAHAAGSIAGAVMALLIGRPSTALETLRPPTA